jgi:hypothetical protein
MGRKHLSIAEAEAVIAEARRIPRRMKADALARWLGVTYAERQRLGLTRIGACDVGKRARTILRKRRARLALQHKRRKAGVRPRTEYLAQSLSRVRPWEAEGISRRTWERRQRARHAVSLVDTTRDIAAWAG